MSSRAPRREPCCRRRPRAWSPGSWRPTAVRSTVVAAHRSRSTSTSAVPCCPSSPRMPCRSRPPSGSPAGRGGGLGCRPRGHRRGRRGPHRAAGLDVMTVPTWRPARVRRAPASRTRADVAAGATFPLSRADGRASARGPPTGWRPASGMPCRPSPQAASRMPSREWSGGGRGSRRPVTTPSPARCSSPTRSAPLHPPGRGGARPPRRHHGRLGRAARRRRRRLRGPTGRDPRRRRRRGRRGCRACPSAVLAIGHTSGPTP